MTKETKVAHSTNILTRNSRTILKYAKLIGLSSVLSILLFKIIIMWLFIRNIDFSSFIITNFRYNPSKEGFISLGCALENNISPMSVYVKNLKVDIGCNQNDVLKAFLDKGEIFKGEFLGLRGDFRIDEFNNNEIMKIAMRRGKLSINFTAQADFRPRFCLIRMPLVNRKFDRTFEINLGSFVSKKNEHEESGVSPDFQNNCIKSDETEKDEIGLDKKDVDKLNTNNDVFDSKAEHHKSNNNILEKDREMKNINTGVISEEKELAETVNSPIDDANCFSGNDEKVHSSFKECIEFIANLYNENLKVSGGTVGECSRYSFINNFIWTDCIFEIKDDGLCIFIRLDLSGTRFTTFLDAYIPGCELVMSVPPCRIFVEAIEIKNGVFPPKINITAYLLKKDSDNARDFIRKMLMKEVFDLRFEEFKSLEPFTCPILKKFFKGLRITMNNKQDKISGHKTNKFRIKKITEKEILFEVVLSLFDKNIMKSYETFNKKLHSCNFECIVAGQKYGSVDMGITSISPTDIVVEIYLDDANYGDLLDSVILKRNMVTLKSDAYFFKEIMRMESISFDLDGRFCFNLSDSESNSENSRVYNFFASNSDATNPNDLNNISEEEIKNEDVTCDEYKFEHEIITHEQSRKIIISSKLSFLDQSFIVLKDDFINLTIDPFCINFFSKKLNYTIKTEVNQDVFISCNRLSKQKKIYGEFLIKTELIVNKDFFNPLPYVDEFLDKKDNLFLVASEFLFKDCKFAGADIFKVINDFFSKKNCTNKMKKLENDIAKQEIDQNGNYLLLSEEIRCDSRVDVYNKCNSNIKEEIENKAQAKNSSNSQNKSNANPTAKSIFDVFKISLDSISQDRINIKIQTDEVLIKKPFIIRNTFIIKNPIKLKLNTKSGKYFSFLELNKNNAKTQVSILMSTTGFEAFQLENDLDVSFSIPATSKGSIDLSEMSAIISDIDLSSIVNKDDQMFFLKFVLHCNDLIKQKYNFKENNFCFQRNKLGCLYLVFKHEIKDDGMDSIVFGFAFEKNCQISCILKDIEGGCKKETDVKHKKICECSNNDDSSNNLYNEKSCSISDSASDDDLSKDKMCDFHTNGSKKNARYTKMQNEHPESKIDYSFETDQKEDILSGKGKGLRFSLPKLKFLITNGNDDSNACIMEIKTDNFLYAKSQKIFSLPMDRFFVTINFNREISMFKNPSLKIIADENVNLSAKYTLKGFKSPYDEKEGGGFFKKLKFIAETLSLLYKDGQSNAKSSELVSLKTNFGIDECKNRVVKFIPEDSGNSPPGSSEECFSTSNSTNPQVDDSTSQDTDITTNDNKNNMNTSFDLCDGKLVRNKTRPRINITESNFDDQQKNKIWNLKFTASNLSSVEQWILLFLTKSGTKVMPSKISFYFDVKDFDLLYITLADKPVVDIRIENFTIVKNEFSIDYKEKKIENFLLNCETKIVLIDDQTFDVYSGQCPKFIFPVLFPIIDLFKAMTIDKDVVNDSFCSLIHSSQISWFKLPCPVDISWNNKKNFYVLVKIQKMLKIVMKFERFSLNGRVSVFGRYKLCYWGESKESSPCEFGLIDTFRNFLSSMDSMKIMIIYDQKVIYRKKIVIKGSGIIASTYKLDSAVMFESFSILQNYVFKFFRCLFGYEKDSLISCSRTDMILSSEIMNITSDCFEILENYSFDNL